MSVVAWDGRTLAADSLAAAEDMRVRVRKIMRAPDGAVLAWVGCHEVGLLLYQWYTNGAKPAEWPEAQKTDSWARLLVATEEGLVEYEKHPVPQPVQTSYAAFGSGGAYAMGAMAMGATAVTAVEVAIEHCVSVGGPIDYFNVGE